MKKRTSPLTTLFFLFAIAAVAVLFVAFAVSIAGCGVDDATLSSTSPARGDNGGGAPTARNCAHPPRYEDVTAFRTSCERCHASTLPVSRREGAPLDVNFDTYDAAVAASHASYGEVESGGMPPDETLSAPDRRTIIDWIRCGMPR